ncbi:hypothetical protein IWW36_002169, partial [Coemansia brasiliensis]
QTLQQLAQLIRLRPMLLEPLQILPPIQKRMPTPPLPISSLVLRQIKQHSRSSKLRRSPQLPPPCQTLRPGSKTQQLPRLRPTHSRQLTQRPKCPRYLRCPRCRERRQATVQHHRHPPRPPPAQDRTPPTSLRHPMPLHRTHQSGFHRRNHPRKNQRTRNQMIHRKKRTLRKVALSWTPSLTRKTAWTRPITHWNPMMLPSLMIWILQNHQRRIPLMKPRRILLIAMSSALIPSQIATSVLPLHCLDLLVLFCAWLVLLRFS